MSRAMQMFRLLTLVGIISVLLASYALGITYEYTGPNFTEGSPLRATERISATLTLGNPLEANFGGALDLTSLPGFSLVLTDGYRTLTTNATLNVKWGWIFSTDSAGLPSEWDLLLAAFNTTTLEQWNMVTALIYGWDPEAKKGFYQKFDISQVLPYTPTMQDAWYSSSPSGPDSTGWSVLTTPEPSSLVLLGFGIAGLIGFRLKSRKCFQQ